MPVCVLVFPVTNKLDPYPLEKIHRQVLSLCEKHSFRAYDLLESFRAYLHQEGSGVYFDYFHSSVSGAHFTAVVALSMLLRDSMLPQVKSAEVARRLLDGGTEEDQRFGRLANLLSTP